MNCTSVDYCRYFEARGRIPNTKVKKITDKESISKSGGKEINKDN
jgi:hypothetical protein